MALNSVVTSGAVGPGRVRVVALSIALLAVFLYIPALGNGFVAWDDGPFVQGNPFIRSLDLSLLRESFLRFHASIPNWIPLAFLSHAVDHALWGMNPAGHHLTSVLLHGLNTYLVVILAVRIIRAGSMLRPVNGDSGEATAMPTVIAAATTGLLFAIHPVHVESVVWISERKDVLCATFTLLAVHSYLHFALRMARTKNAPLTVLLSDRFYGMTVLWCSLALMSKPMAVTLPAVLLILDWYPLRRRDEAGNWTRLVAEKVPFALLALGTAALAVLAERNYGGIVNADPFGFRIGVALEAVPRYLGILVYPFPLLPFYPRPRSVDLLSLPVIGSLLVVLGITAMVLWLATKEQRSWLALWSGFIVMLSPVLGLVQVGEHAMADRFLYLPSLAAFGAAGYGVAFIYSRVSASPRMWAAAVAGGGGIAVTVVLAALTVSQISVWRDSVALWSQVIRYEPATAKAYHQRGNEYLRRQEFRRALDDFNETLGLDPTNANGYDDRGIVCAEMGLLPEAIQDFNRAIAMSPLTAGFYRNRGTAFSQMGLGSDAQKDFQRADSLERVAASGAR